MERTATFSECRKYRFVLTRHWEELKPTAMCIGLNPSNANAEKDDPTIRILCKALKNLGYGTLHMLNLYSLVSSNPRKLLECADPQNNNDEWLKEYGEIADEVIFCWGSFKNISWRAKQIIKLFPDAKCFGRNKDGSPIHPMALMYSGKTWEAKLEDYELH